MDVEARREAILEVAARIFREKGYDNARLEEIAAELGVTRASFYYYFRGKQEILEAIYEIGIQAVEEIGRVFDEDMPPVPTLAALVTRMAELVGGSPWSGVFFRELHGLSPEFRRVLDEKRSAFDHRVIDFLERAKKTGTLRVSDPHVTAYAILGSIDWMHVWYQPNGPLSARAVGELMAEQWLSGLAPSLDDEDNVEVSLDDADSLAPL